MIVTKIALTLGIICILVPFVVAPFDDDFKPNHNKTFRTLDWAVIYSAAFGAFCLVIALLAFIWGL